MDGKNVDGTDLRILAHLCADAKTTSKEIAKRIGLSSKTVNSRIQRLEQEGIITVCITMCDLFNLGYRNYLVDIKLKDDSDEIRREMLMHLASSPDTWWVTELCGNIDLQVVFWTKKDDGFLDIWSSFKKRYRRYIQDADIQPYFGMEQCPMPPAKKYLEKRKLFRFGKGPQYRLKRKESELLTLLAQNGSIQLSELSKQLDLPISSVKYKIDHLKKIGVIIGSTIVLDHVKLGYRLHLVDIYLNSMDGLDEIEAAILEDGNSWHLLRTSGKADIRCTMLSKDHSELHGAINRLKSAFPGQISEAKASRFNRIVKGVPFAIK